MKRTLLLAAVVLTLGFAAAAQPEFIGVFRYTNGCPCEIFDRGGPAVLSVVVLHVDSPGAKGSQFSVPTPQCATWIMLSSPSPFPTVIGSPLSGIIVGYGGCKTGTFLVLTMDFFVQGLTEECCYYSVEPDPAVPSGRIEVANCNDQIVYVFGGEDLINSNTQCVCAPGPVTCHPVAVNESTWGSIKNLYR